MSDPTTTAPPLTLETYLHPPKAGTTRRRPRGVGLTPDQCTELFTVGTVNGQPFKVRRPAVLPTPERLAQYGLDEFDYCAMYDYQNGLCAVCGGCAPLHIDHCHTRGHVRGLLCVRCNTGMGQFRDNPNLHRAAAAYLDSRRDERAAYEYIPRQESWMGIGSPYQKLGYAGKHTSAPCGDFLTITRNGEHVAEVAVIIPPCLGARAEIRVQRRHAGECEVIDCGTFEGEEDEDEE